MGLQAVSRLATDLCADGSEELFKQWKDLEAPSRSTRLLVKLKNPVHTDQAYVNRDIERKQKEEEHKHAFWQGQEYKRAVEEAEARINTLEADIECYTLEAENHSRLHAEVKAIHTAVFAGIHNAFPQELELRDRIDMVAAHGVDFAQKLAVEQKALGMFPLMLEEAEHAERQFRKAIRADSDNQRRHVRKAEKAYELARKKETEIRRLKPSVVPYPADMPSFSFFETGDWSMLFRRGFSERKAYCSDLILHMRRQWDIAKRDASEMAQGVKELNMQLKVMERQLEKVRARILLNKAAEMGLGGEVDEQELDRLALGDVEDRMFAGDGLTVSICSIQGTLEAPPPAYSKYCTPNSSLPPAILTRA